MKAITLTQPWATLVAIGAKRIETRSWSTRYRGRLAIHAAKGYTNDAVKIAFTQPFQMVLSDAGYKLFSVLPRGAIVATCELVSVGLILRMPPVEILSWKWRGPDETEYCYEVDDQERFFGDYSHGRYAWMLYNVQPLPDPIPTKGALGLWEWAEPIKLRLP